MNKIKKYLSRKNIIFVSLLILCLTMGFSFCYSYFTSKGTFDVSANLKVIGFDPWVNQSGERSQNINLATTITNHKSLSPGAEGKFKIDVAFSNDNIDTYYKLYYDRTNIPDNLHFYVDKNFTTELTSIEGIHFVDDYNLSSEHYIYWKWDYVDSEEANENDNLYMNENITVTFKVDVKHHLDNRTIIINGFEDEAGTQLAIEKSGTVDLNMDFKNLSPTNYKVYFDNSALTDSVHFYSDSNYTNEITYISGYYDGNNNKISRKVYWKTIDSSNVSGLVHYVVVFE